MSIIDSILNFFRRKPEELSTETPKEIRVNPLAATTNLITLSPDMSTLYLIDNNRVISFDLNTKFGVNIGTIDGQLTAATAVPVIFPTDEDEGGEETDAPDDVPIEEDPGVDPGDHPIHRLAERPRYFKISTVSRQFTLMFNKKLGVVSIIGASDIDTSIIGASDIDTSIIGASDIDTSIARKIREEPEVESIPEAFEAQSSKAKCYIFSFRVSEKSINLRKVGALLIIRY